MNEFNDDEFDMSDEEFDAFNRDFAEKRKALSNHPLMKSGREVFDLLNALLDTIEDEGKQEMFGYLREDATILLAKIAGAIASESWLVSMGNASLIRHHAYSLYIATHTLGEFTDTDNAYIRLLRTEMESFKEVFKHWMSEVQSMDRDGEVDDWGVFV